MENSATSLEKKGKSNIGMLRMKTSRRNLSPSTIWQTFGYEVLLFLMKLRKQVMTPILCNFYDYWMIPRDIMAVFLVFGTRWKLLVWKLTDFLDVVSMDISFLLRCRVLSFIFSRKYFRGEPTTFAGTKSKSKGAVFLNIYSKVDFSPFCRNLLNIPLNALQFSHSL